MILPIIGVIDRQRAHQLTEQLLRGIRTNRVKVLVIDVTGLSPEIALNEDVFLFTRGSFHIEQDRTGVITF